ncbi:MAG: hypothetical protein HUJ67_03930 [Ruminiclostridium sp.]|nr:hypothetical protein [Ruminiclostridium sp.]
MKKMNNAEMRAVEGGAYECMACYKTYKTNIGVMFHKVFKGHKEYWKV